MDKTKIQTWLQSLQDKICIELENVDGKSRFRQDSWERKEGGGGRTRVIENGNVISKGGVNFSAVFGKTPENILQALKLSPSDFFATGISIVLHPRNPWVPIIHMNLRYFEMSDGTRWFGGGIDLTPHYIIPDDARFFHQKLKEVCDKHDPTYYNKFKNWADEYFFIKHRNETRGIGGVFFDRLTGTDSEMEQFFEFIKDCGNIFAPTYIELIHRNNNKSYNDHELLWQSLRRGRYVEFNLVYDKGTKFGLDTDGRIESILMSLPPVAEWKYDFKPTPDSQEADTLRFLTKGINWV